MKVPPTGVSGNLDAKYYRLSESNHHNGWHTITSENSFGWETCNVYPPLHPLIAMTQRQASQESYYHDRAMRSCLSLNPLSQNCFVSPIKVSWLIGLEHKSFPWSDFPIQQSKGHLQSNSSNLIMRSCLSLIKPPLLSKTCFVRQIKGNWLIGLKHQSCPCSDWQI